MTFALIALLIPITSKLSQTGNFGSRRWNSLCPSQHGRILHFHALFVKKHYKIRWCPPPFPSCTASFKKTSESPLLPIPEMKISEPEIYFRVIWFAVVKAAVACFV